MRVLLVEDDCVISDFVSRGLNENGHTVLCADNGLDGLDLALNENYDVAIIDLMLPNLDGSEIIERMRFSKIKSPVLILSAKRTVDDRVAGLRKGGDDYLTKPFAFAELLARVEALQRRTTDAEPASTLSLDDLHMDLLSRTVTRNGVRVVLQPKEFALLEYLLRNVGHVVSKTMIMERVWNYNFNPDTNIVEARISKLREKIDKPFSSSLLHTIRGSGYVLKMQDD